MLPPDFIFISEFRITKMHWATENKWAYVVFRCDSSAICREDLQDVDRKYLIICSCRHQPISVYLKCLASAFGGGFDLNFVVIISIGFRSNCYDYPITFSSMLFSSHPYISEVQIVNLVHHMRNLQMIFFCLCISNSQHVELIDISYMLYKI